MRKKYSGILWGLAFITVGVLMLLDRLDIIYFNFGKFISVWWPLILVFIGVGMMLDSVSKQQK